MNIPVTRFPMGSVRRGNKSALWTNPKGAIFQWLSEAWCHMKTLEPGFSIAAAQWARPVSARLLTPITTLAISSSEKNRMSIFITCMQFRGPFGSYNLASGFAPLTQSVFSLKCYPAQICRLCFGFVKSCFWKVAGFAFFVFTKSSFKPFLYLKWKILLLCLNPRFRLTSSVIDCVGLCDTPGKFCSWKETLDFIPDKRFYL